MSTESIDGPPSMTRAYKRYALILMTTVFTVNLIDRSLLTVLLEPIRVDLGLSDSQMGLVTGFAFGAFYAFAGIPLSRWADHGDRRLITAGSIGIWSLTAIALAMVGSFTQLIAARVTAAIGEAGCKPPTYSLIGDYYPGAAERARAMSVYWLSNPVAALIGFAAGGWLNELFGWRKAFLIMSCPGVVLALLVWFTLREPRRALLLTTPPPPVPPLRTAVEVLWRQRTARNLVIAMVLFYTMAYGMSSWFGAFLIRSHGMATGELGLWLGLLAGGGGLIGIPLGGLFAGRWLAGDERGQLRWTALAMALLVPTLSAFLFLDDKYQALAAMAPYFIALFFFLVPCYALFQRLVPDSVRATTLAILMLLTHIVSMGLGPQIIGIFSDLLAPRLGVDSLRYAMFFVSLIAFLASFQFWKAGRTVAADLSTLAAATTSSYPPPLPGPD